MSVIETLEYEDSFGEKAKCVVKLHGEENVIVQFVQGDPEILKEQEVTAWGFEDIDTFKRWLKMLTRFDERISNQ